MRVTATKHAWSFVWVSRMPGTIGVAQDWKNLSIVSVYQLGSLAQNSYPKNDLDIFRWLRFTW